ncbi:MAG: hypothetical protein M3Z25_05820 [Actinomycetota bacterium]|nr:hypothetical protein [Actinomycetota bacterium]
MNAPETNEAGQHGMSRRQLLRHGAWFGAAVALTVVGGEVISHGRRRRWAAHPTGSGR